MKSFNIRSLSRTNGFWCIPPVLFALLATAALLTGIAKRNLEVENICVLAQDSNHEPFG